MSTIELNVQDMTCASCVKHVSEALQGLAGVETVEVDLATGRVRVTGTAESAALIAALDDAGYGAELAAARPGSCGGHGGCGCH